MKNYKQTERQVVFMLLNKMDKNNGYSNIYLNNFFIENKNDELNKEYITSYFYGVLEKKITIDHIIKHHSTTRIGKIDIEFLTALRMGIYELLYMNSKDYAVVNEIIDIVKKKVGAKRAGFINGILRSFLRSNKKIPLDNLTKYQYYSIIYSLPIFLVESFIHDYGLDEAKKIFESLQLKSPIYIRVNAKKINAGTLKKELLKEGIEASFGPIEHSLIIKRGNVVNTKSYIDGMFHIQDLSSQILCKVISGYDSKTILDVAAAPGGKTFTIAQSEGVQVISCDIHGFKIDLINAGLKRLGLNNVVAKLHDGTKNFDKKFDLVLCDLPCSGFGVIRRKPEIKSKNLEIIKDLPELQLKILNSAKNAVKENGILVYSTCTLRKAENEAVRDRFLIENKNFISELLPGSVSEIFNGVNGSQITIKPYYLDSDGFYFTLFRNRGHDEQNRY